MSEEIKGSAKAHPIQGLVKYHGLKNRSLRIPYHDSISVATAPWQTHTTVAFSQEFQEDTVEIDGHLVEGRAKERVSHVLDGLRKKARIRWGAKVVSVNSFPSNIGLGASSSGFAALTLAAAKALNLELTERELTCYARIGAGSASRAVPGGFAYWKAGEDHKSSYAFRLESPLEMAILVAIVRRHKETEDAHREAVASPFFAARLTTLPIQLQKMRRAIEKGDFEQVGEIAEQDTLSLHAVTMTGPKGHLHWGGQTLEVMHTVRALRQEGVPVYFSIDTGATVYVNTLPLWRDKVKSRLEELGVEVQIGWIGGPATVVEEHLF